MKVLAGCLATINSKYTIYKKWCIERIYTTELNRTSSTTTDKNSLPLIRLLMLLAFTVKLCFWRVETTYG